MLSSTPLLAQRIFQISPSGITAVDPKISADGKVVVFDHRFGAGLTTVRPDGSGLESLNLPVTYQASLSGDGRLLVWNAGENAWGEGTGGMTVQGAEGVGNACEP